MADKAWGCIMADEMGLGEFALPVYGLSQTDRILREDAAMYRPSLDTAQAVASRRKAHLREGDRGLPYIASRQLG